MTPPVFAARSVFRCTAALLLPLGALRVRFRGQTTCFDLAYAVPCEESTTDDSSTMPGQDARYGRDALAALGRLPKVGWRRVSVLAARANQRRQYDPWLGAAVDAARL